MQSNVGFRIYSKIKRPNPEILKKFYGIPSSNIGDQMNRMYCMNSSIKALNKVETMVGTAFTIRVPAGDNLMIHKALDMALPGDVLIIDGQGCMERSLAGEIMLTYAFQKGLHGIVVDGVLRDLDGILRMELPVYAKGITPQGPYKNGPGEINVPVSCGGIAVLPGDVIVGDQDGIAVIRPEDVLNILEKSHEKYRSEEAKLKTYRSGDLDTQIRIDNYNKVLEQKGISYL